ncbi:integrating conjugative element relaxase (TIGR03760 family) [Pseudomonas lurida]|jgi:integrating conjugative element relaxase (TIGR03760 family)|uniref:MobH family relaxase n=1 Tax=Pseudomonas lurida TaxID=244566 RepID=UPI000BF771E1|nr:MobH family relaxase [Pseudomonas lurida]PFG25069.1 integrating conjugative element relaxase (TIGR03760 family) [Pseudomonas lurida]
MFWQSKKKKAAQTESQTFGADPHEYLAPRTASELLSTPRRRKLLEHIWQRTSLSRSQFDDLYLEPVRRYAELVQQLPASENHHHAYPGGMLDHGLEIVAFALKIRQSHLLPVGATPETQAAQTEIWTAALAYAALLHDIGKIAVDVEVHLADGTRWHPWHGPISRNYRFKYLKEREYTLHGAAAGLLYTQILTQPVLDWLSSYTDPWSALIYVLAGQYEHAGTLGELVMQADQASVAQELGGNPSRALAAPKHSAQRQLIEGLRYLVTDQLKLNQPRASDGWLTENALWLVSKTVADKLRAHLLSQGADSIPSSNSTLFNVLQDNAIIQVNAEGKAIWTATVQSGKWQKTLTFLKVAPALIWERGERPPSFSGLITVGPALEPSGEEAHIEVATFPQRPPDILVDTSPVLTEKPTETSYKLVPDEYMEATQYPDDLWEGQRTCMTEENDSCPSYLFPPNKGAAPTESLYAYSQPQYLPDVVPKRVEMLSGIEQGKAFVRWLRRGVVTHKVVINDAKAKVHSVAGTAFLVTPGIFQRYAQEHPELARVAKEQGTTDWRWVQRCFEKLSIHEKCASGLNIWACEVRGPRKTRDIRGYLLKDPLQIFTEKPYDNPYLALKGSPTFKDEAPCM